MPKDNLAIYFANYNWSSVTLVEYNSNGTDLTADTDYTAYTASSTIYFKNTTKIQNICLAAGNNATNVTYVWYPNDYVRDTTSRTLIGLFILFFAIGVLAYVIYYFWAISREWRERF